MPDLLLYLANLGPYEITGVIGFFVYILAFGSVQLGLLDGNTTSYSLSNVLAALLVAISLVHEFNLASALIQGSWIAIGLVGLGLRTRNAWSSTRRVLNTTLDMDAV